MQNFSELDQGRADQMLPEAPQPNGGANPEEVAGLHRQDALQEPHRHAAHENEAKVLPRDGGKDTARLARFLLAQAQVRLRHEEEVLQCVGGQKSNHKVLLLEIL